MGKKAKKKPKSKKTGAAARNRRQSGTSQEAAVSSAEFGDVASQVKTDTTTGNDENVPTPQIKIPVPAVDAKADGAATAAAGDVSENSFNDNPGRLAAAAGVPDELVLKAAEDALKEAEELLQEQADNQAKAEPVVEEEKKAEPVEVEATKPSPVVEGSAPVEQEPEPVVDKEPDPVTEAPKKEPTAPVVEEDEPEPASVVKEEPKQESEESRAPVEDPVVETKKPEMVVEKPKAVPPAVTKVVAPTTQSKGLALDKPAPEEADAAQKDCECTIL